MYCVKNGNFENPAQPTLMRRHLLQSNLNEPIPTEPPPLPTGKQVLKTCKLIPRMPPVCVINVQLFA